MLLSFGLAALLQTQPRQSPSDSIAREITRRITERADERARRAAEAGDRPSHVKAVTPEHLASAFKDARARNLLTTARAARFAQDSALVSYDATAYQRISASLAFTRLARPRLVFRNE